MLDFLAKWRDSDPQKRNLRKVVKNLGYDIRQKQYHYDYITSVSQWSSHISGTRQFISDCARRSFGRRSCVVLGSGYCLDVPILELSRMFDKVYLVDLVHPHRILQKLKSFNNVEAVTEDITKIAVETLNSINRYKDFAVDVLVSSPNYSSGNYCDNLSQFDLVISVNVLSFLCDPIIAYLSRLKLVDDISSNALQQFVHQYHINMLPKGKSCIISPISKRLYDEDDLQMSDQSVAYIPKEVIREPQTWTWDYSKNSTGRIEYSVKAWEY